MSPFRIVLFGVVIFLLSLLTLRDLNVSFIPTSQAQTFSIFFDYPNHPPRIVEQEVTSIIENELSQLADLKGIYSRSRYGEGSIQLTFPTDADLTFREMELHMILRQLRGKLPKELSTPQVSRNSTEDKDQSPILVYEFTYTNDDLAANSWLENILLPQLGSLGNIEQVETIGNIKYAWKIQFDPDRLKKLSISRKEVIQKLRFTFQRSEIGLLDWEDQTNPLFTHLSLENREQIENLVLKNTVRLSDVASIELAGDSIRRLQRINGKKAIFINCYAHEGSNRLQTAEEINTYIQALGSQIPPHYDIRLNYDDTAYLSKELNKTWTRAILSILVIMLFIFLSSFNWKYLLILISSIFVSLALTVLMAWLFGLAFHLYTLAGLTIAIGILVDNAIVLVDHFRKKGDLSVIPAQLASSITTVIALTVIWVLPQEYRQNLDDFGLIICISLFASLLVSTMFSPAISMLLGFSQSNPEGLTKNNKLQLLLQSGSQRILGFSLRYKKLVLTLFILGFGLPIFLLPSKLENQNWYNETIGSDFYQEHLKAPINRWLGGSLRLFYQKVYEKSSYRTPEKTRLYVNAALPYGHTLEQMNDIISATESYLLDFPEIDKFLAKVYSGRYGSISIEFTEKAEKAGFPYKLKNRLIRRSLDWGGVTWNVYGVGKGFSNANNESLPGFRVKLKGYQYERLEQIAEILAEELLQHKRIQEVNTNGQLDWGEESLSLYRFKPDIKQLMGNEYQNTLQYLANHSLQLYPSLYLNYQDKDYPVYLESMNAEDLSIFTSMHTGNDQVPLSYFGKLIQQNTLNTLHKEDRQYIRNVSFDYYGSHRFGKKYLDEVIDQMKTTLPPGFSIEHEEWSWNKDQEKRRYELILILMTGIFFVSTIFLESIRKGFLVMLIIPFSFIGIFLTFGLGGFAFDQGGYAAFLMIGGLSVNALLYILSDYGHLVKRYDASKAMALAINQKAWPILLTVISTCSGLIPFLIHGDSEVFWFSFAIGTIGGLFFSLIVVFWLMPILILPKSHLKTSTS